MKKLTLLTAPITIAALFISQIAIASTEVKELYSCEYDMNNVMMCIYTNGDCEDVNGGEVECPAHINFEKIPEPIEIETYSLPTRGIYSCDYTPENLMVCAYLDGTCEDLEENMVECPANLLR